MTDFNQLDVSMRLFLTVAILASFSVQMLVVIGFIQFRRMKSAPLWGLILELAILAQMVLSAFVQVKSWDSSTYGTAKNIGSTGSGIAGRIGSSGSGITGRIGSSGSGITGRIGSTGSGIAGKCRWPHFENGDRPVSCCRRQRRFSSFCHPWRNGDRKISAFGCCSLLFFCWGGLLPKPSFSTGSEGNTWSPDP